MDGKADAKNQYQKQADVAQASHCFIRGRRQERGGSRSGGGDADSLESIASNGSGAGARQTLNINR